MNGSISWGSPDSISFLKGNWDSPVMNSTSFFHPFLKVSIIHNWDLVTPAVWITQCSFGAISNLRSNSQSNEECALGDCCFKSQNKSPGFPVWQCQCVSWCCSLTSSPKQRASIGFFTSMKGRVDHSATTVFSGEFMKPSFKSCLWIPMPSLSTMSSPSTLFILYSVCAFYSYKQNLTLFPY